MGYFITSSIHMTYNYEAISIILKKGNQKFLFEYYLIDYTKLNYLGNKITIEEAIEALLEGTPDKSRLHYCQI